MIKKAFYNVQNREMKSESGFSIAMAGQPFMNIRRKMHASESARNRERCRELEGSGFTLTLSGFSRTLSLSLSLALSNSLWLSLALRIYLKSSLSAHSSATGLHFILVCLKKCCPITTELQIPNTNAFEGQ